MSETVAGTGKEPNGARQAPAASTDGADITPPPEKPPRRRGRPPGQAKTGGRQKGTKNWTSEEVRNALLGKSEAIETLADIVAGRQLLVSGPTGRPIWRYPTLQERLTGLKMLLDKCVPSLIATELSGPGGKALFRPGVDGADSRQTARAVLALLAGGVAVADGTDEPVLASPWSPGAAADLAHISAYSDGGPLTAAAGCEGVTSSSQKNKTTQDSDGGNAALALGEETVSSGSASSLFSYPGGESRPNDEELPERIDIGDQGHSITRQSGKWFVLDAAMNRICGAPTRAEAESGAAMN